MVNDRLANTKTPRTIAVLGAGYVGLSTAALFANAGNTVYLIEPNEARLKTIQQGKSFFYEKGLDYLIAKALKDGTLLPTNSYSESIKESTIIFSCVGTPDNPDGSSNLTYIFQSATEAAKYIKKSAIFVQKSTVPVGTGNKIKDLFKNKEVAYVSNPEFLREGTALYDSLFFDRIVLGSDNLTAVETIEELYRSLEEVRKDIAHVAQIDIPEAAKDGQYIRTDLNSAELIKVTSNAFLALKISFANSIAMLADKADADINLVMDAVGADKRIGRYFLNAGRGYGGGCFPKDVAGLVASAKNLGVDLSIMRAVQEVNDNMASYIIKKVLEQLKNKKGVIAVLGTAFKAGTSDTRRSPGIKIIELLRDSGLTIKTYDPEALHETQEYFRDTSTENLIFAASLEEAIKNVDCTIVTTDWEEFLKLDLLTYRQKMKGNLFVDAVNAFNPSSVKDSGLAYIGVGRR